MPTKTFDAPFKNETSWRDELPLTEALNEASSTQGLRESWTWRGILKPLIQDFDNSSNMAELEIGIF